MKKRVGSKLYNTETSKLIGTLPDGRVLYQKATRECGYFLVDGKEVQPITEEEAHEISKRYHVNLKPRELKPTQSVVMDKETYLMIKQGAERMDLTATDFVRFLVRNYSLSVKPKR